MRSASLRLAALYAAAFAGAVLLIGVVTLVTTGAALTQQFDVRILAESAALAQEFRTEGLTGVTEAVEERDRTPGALDYGLAAPGGALIAGRLAAAGAPTGWSEVRRTRPNRATVRVYSAILPGGYRLLVGGDDEGIEAVGRLLAVRFLLAVLGVVLIGAVAAYGLGRGMGRRIAAITGAASAIIDGDLSRRVPVRGAGDDLDHLAATFNLMLDRVEALMDSLKQVSSDVAHDLRTPLTRLRTRLEARLAPGDGPPDPAIEAALADLDSILETFAAILRISQIEGGARRARFRPTDLAEVARTVADAFTPSAEDAGATLSLTAPEPRVVEGDAELLTQMLVNLIENSLRHAGAGAALRIEVGGTAAVPVLAVRDNGLGVPAGERGRLFDRFYRLERSRSTPGNGLGLALVAAVARLHGADIALLDAEPGLDVRITFAAGSS